MGIKISFNGATIHRPGAYSSLAVNLVGGMPISDTGIVGIIGEASKGAPGSTDGVQTFTSEQLSDLIAKYGSGRIVDAARLLVQPSKDSRVTNGAQSILVYKTNASTKSSLNIQNLDDAASNILAFQSANYGISENLTNMYITDGASSSDTDASVTSDSALVFPLTITNVDTLVVRINGVDYTMTLAGVAGSTFSQADTIALINGTITNGLTPTWTTVRPVTASAVSTNKIKLTIRRTQAPLDKYENMFEYAELTTQTSSLKTLLALTVASTINGTTLVVTEGGAGPVRGSRGGRIFVINSGSVTETLDENDNESVFSIRYLGAGSAATMTISGASDSVKTLTTSCTGAAGDNLNLTLNQFTTIQDLVNYINAFGGGSKYKCVTTYSKADSRAPIYLDRYDAIEIKALPLNVKCALYEIQEIIDSTSTYVTVTRGAYYGQVETISSSAAEFFTGAVLGASTNTSFQNGFDAMLAKRVNIVLPLISQDASTDITSSLTDASSTYDIDSVIAQCDSHCRLASNTKNKSERQAYISYLDTFANTKEAAKDVASEFCTMAFQNVDILDASGTQVTLQPWALACLCAGMQAGSAIGEPTTYKYINAYGISHSTFDPVNDTDTAIDSGLLVVEHPDAGGYRIVCQNTTYGKDQNFTWNRAHVVEAAFYVSYDLRKQLEAIYIGTGRQRSSTSTNAILTTVQSLMDTYLDNGIIVGDSTNNYLGYKDLTVTANGSTITIDVTITPVQGIDFILGRITLDNIRDSASA